MTIYDNNGDFFLEGCAREALINNQIPIELIMVLLQAIPSTQKGMSMQTISLWPLQSPKQILLRLVETLASLCEKIRIAAVWAQ